MKFKKSIFAFIMASLSLTFIGCSSYTPEPEEVSHPRELNIFAGRNYDADRFLYDEFERQTGIEVNVIHGTAEEILERLQMEGSNTSADLFMANDGAILNRAKTLDLLQPISSATVDFIVPDNLKDDDNYWVGFSKRARIFVYATDRVDPASIQNYEDITHSTFENRIAVRSSSHLYNQSLLASFISMYGEEMATNWASSVANNMAKQPSGGDTDQIISVASGVGDVAIVNSYYIGLLQNSSSPEEVNVANSVDMVFPNQETTGTHVNVAGLGITKYSQNVQEATEFIEFLLSVESQNHLTSTNFEIPVNQRANFPEFLAEHQGFKMQDIHLTELGLHNSQAIQIFNRVGWR